MPINQKLFCFICIFIFSAFGTGKAEENSDDGWGFLQEPGPIFVSGCRGSQWDYGKFMIMVSSSEHLRLFVIRGEVENEKTEFPKGGNLGSKEKFIPEFVGSYRFMKDSQKDGVDSWVGGKWTLNVLMFLKEQPFELLKHEERKPEFVLQIAENLNCPKEINYKD